MQKQRMKLQRGRENDEQIKSPRKSISPKAKVTVTIGGEEEMPGIK
jgi:hypothetical protein